MELGAARPCCLSAIHPVTLWDTDSTGRLGKILCVEGAVHQVEEPQTKPEGLPDSADITDIPHNSRASRCTR